MFCPVCKAEYRSGFTRCSDCDVDLVERLESAGSTSPETGQAGLDNAVLLWTGADLHVQAAICDALDEAQIFYHKRSRDVGLFPNLMESSAYGIVVRGRDRDAAEAVLEKVARELEIADPEQADADKEAAAEEIPELEDDDGQPAPDDIGEDFSPEDATAEVWSGSDKEMAETVQICLRENGIGCVVDGSDFTRRIRVMPQAEKRAREIVREVVEGVPPE